jgi:hypothetical protein
VLRVSESFGSWNRSATIYLLAPLFTKEQSLKDPPSHRCNSLFSLTGTSSPVWAWKLTHRVPCLFVHPALSLVIKCHLSFKLSLHLGHQLTPFVAFKHSCALTMNCFPLWIQKESVCFCREECIILGHLASRTPHSALFRSLMPVSTCTAFPSGCRLDAHDSQSLGAKDPC